MEIIGLKFNRLTVISKSSIRNKGRNFFYNVICDCGVKKIVLKDSLIRGTTKSCGCYHIEQAAHLGRSKKTHGKTSSSIYHVYKSMMQRCYDKNNRAYEQYGGRGITVSPNWQTFENFYRDMGDKPNNKSLDRVDNNKSYSKENCQWATRREQANNTRSNRFITFNGNTKTLAQWADFYQLRIGTLWYRLKSGWSLDRAFTRITK